MTPAEAQEIDRIEFAAECAAIRERAYAIAKSHKEKKQQQPESFSAELNEALDEKPYITLQAPKVRGHTPRLYTANGKSLTINQWSVETGIAAGTLRFRLTHGWTIEDAVSRPLGSRLKDTHDQQLIGRSKGYTAFGKTMTIKQWAEETGMPQGLIRNRLWRGWSIEEAVTLARKRIISLSK